MNTNTNTNTNTMTLKAFVSIRKSPTTGNFYFRLYKDGQAYQIHDAESAGILTKVTGALNKSNLIAVQRTRANGETWEDIQLRFPLKLTIQVDGDADGGAKFATILDAKRVEPMKLSIDINGVEKRTPNYGAKRAAVVAAESEDADAPATL